MTLFTRHQIKEKKSRKKNDNDSLWKSFITSMSSIGYVKYLIGVMYWYYFRSLKSILKIDVKCQSI